MPQENILTYPLLGLSVFARQVCLPIPAVLFLISAGTLAHDGKLNLVLVLATAVVGAVAGDALWFEAGRYWGSHILRILTNLSDDPKALSTKARAIFSRYGLLSLLVAKFLPGLDGITPPLAGMEGTSRVAFFLFDGGGSLLWSAAYVGVGLYFSKQVDVILGVLHSSERLLFVVLGIPLLVYAAWRGTVILQMLKKLRTRHISPALLWDRLSETPDRVLVIDLLEFQQQPEAALGIPGAVRIDPARLRRKGIIEYPAGLSFVLYASNSSSYRCARVALALKRRGIDDVWILEGGVGNWSAAGLPTTDQLLNEDQAMAKYGMRIRTIEQPHRSSSLTFEALPEGRHL